MAKENIGKVFKTALAKYIPKGHPLNKIMNEHTIKLSYSTTANMASKMGSHNNKVENTNSEEKTPKRICSCPKTKAKQKFQCQFEGKCLEEGVIYKASAPTWNYIGLTKGNIKERISKHVHSFKNPDKEHETKLSTKMWELGRVGNIPELKWEKITIAPPRGPNRNTCILCNKEALTIMRSNHQNINLR